MTDREFFAYMERMKEKTAELDAASAKRHGEVESLLALQSGRGTRAAVEILLGESIVQAGRLRVIETTLWGERS